MKKQLLTNIFSLLRLLLFVIAGATLLLTPFLAKVWKEGEGHRLSVKKAKLEQLLIKEKSKSTTVELEIKQLLSTQRLRKYAEDSLPLRQPKAAEIIVLRREEDGQVLQQEVGLFESLRDMMRVQ